MILSKKDRIRKQLTEKQTKKVLNYRQIQKLPYPVNLAKF
jgi:hypothetical protein